jgi:NADH-quinone oxidoreductase subunit M
MTDHLLTYLVLIPIGGAIATVFLPRQAVGTIRAFSVGTMGLVFVLSLWLLEADYTAPGFHFVEQGEWVPAVGIAYKVGVDGLSLWLVLLTTLITPLALWVSWLGIKTKVKEYAVSFLLLEATMLGAFVSLDVFLFYVYWELMLVPMYLIVGIWGGPRRVYAALKFFLYTFVGSLIMLAAILYLVVTYHELTGGYSFDLEELSRVVLPYETQLWLFAAFALAFAIKVPVFPFHTWLPDAHVEAPTGGSVILASVMLKLGTYGFLRYAMPLFPLASHYLGPTIALLAVIGIIYGAWCAWVQRDVKKLIAYSSVSHLGFIMLGLFAMNGAGVAGAVLQMVNHGISTGALFILIGVIYERRHTRDLDQFGGLARDMPVFATLFVIVALASIGLPTTNGFIGEFMVLVATFTSDALRPSAPWFAILAATGTILAAVYMLHALLKMFWGPMKHPENEGLADMKLGFWDVMSLTPLFVLVLWLTPLRGIWVGALGSGFSSGVFREVLGAGLLLLGIVALHGFALAFLRRARATAPRDDARRIESMTVLPLVVLIFWIGLFPNTFLSALQPAADRFVASFQERLQIQNADDSVRILDGERPPAAPGASATAQALVPGEGAQRR